MAKVHTQAHGSQSILEKEADTIAQLRAQLELDDSYQATVNGEPEDDDYELQDYEFVAFAAKVKGGC